MRRPVCVKCQIEFKPLKNGQAVVTMCHDTPPFPYQLFDADSFKCPGCGAEIVSGFGREPLYENWRPDFESLIPADVVRCYERLEDVPAAVNPAEPSTIFEHAKALTRAYAAGVNFEQESELEERRRAV